MAPKTYGGPGKGNAYWMRELRKSLGAGTICKFNQEIARTLIAVGTPCLGCAGSNQWIADLQKALGQSFQLAAERERLGYLAFNGKVEGAVRDEVVWHLTKGLPDSLGSAQHWVGREYRHVDGVVGRGTSSAEPLAAFQAKQICVADIFSKSNDLLRCLNLDMRVKAPCNLGNRSPSVQAGLLLVLDYGQDPLPSVPTFAYEQLCVRQQKEQWSATEWRRSLEDQLATLHLDIVAQSSTAWQLRAPPPGRSPYSMHWFVLMPMASPDSQCLTCHAIRPEIAVA